MFRRSTVRYGKTPEPETPFQRAGQVWDERIGSARVQAKNWRLAFFAALALSGGLAGALVWQQCAHRLANWWEPDSKSNAADQTFSALLARSDKILQIIQSSLDIDHHKLPGVRQP